MLTVFDTHGQEIVAQMTFRDAIASPDMEVRTLATALLQNGLITAMNVAASEYATRAAEEIVTFYRPKVN
jgi:hypothetical protein